MALCRSARVALSCLVAALAFGATTAALHAATLVVDLRARPQQSKFVGDQAWAEVGAALAVGDLNGDG